ncbi:hypothetical protein LA080_006229 [Diaporthe eres]|nr:hypothetical protein LA080_006229 [Diaporthe eres]
MSTAPTTTDSNRFGANGLGKDKNSNTKPQGRNTEDPKTPAAAAAATVQHAENHADDDDDDDDDDDAAAARAALRRQAKPVFNRGPSMLDFTAITSAGPTPAAAGEAGGPAASYFDGSRLRESHLPDEGEEVEVARMGRQAETMERRRARRQTVTEADSGELPRRDPGGEAQGGGDEWVDRGQ